MKSLTQGRDSEEDSHKSEQLKMTRKMILSAMLFGIMAFAISIPVSAVPAPLHHWDASNPYGNGTAPVNGAKKKAKF